MKIEIISDTIQLTPENDAESIYLKYIFDPVGYNVYKSSNDISKYFTLIYNLEKKLEIK